MSVLSLLMLQNRESHPVANRKNGRGAPLTFWIAFEADEHVPPVIVPGDVDAEFVCKRGVQHPVDAFEADGQARVDAADEFEFDQEAVCVGAIPRVEGTLDLRAGLDLFGPGDALGRAVVEGDG